MSEHITNKGKEAGTCTDTSMGIGRFPGGFEILTEDVVMKVTPE